MAETVIQSADREQCFASPTLHRLAPGVHDIPGYTDAESFGPDLCIEVVESDDEAIEVLRKSPFGLANSIFTASDRRFDRYMREVQSGILNRNRSTNLASPRLPFGGVGRSGNYRPAGAHAPRNVVSAVAVQENVIGRVTVHPHLLKTMPPPQLDRLEAQHRAEEAIEAERNLVNTPRPRSITNPTGGHLPQSDAWPHQALLRAIEWSVRKSLWSLTISVRLGRSWFQSTTSHSRFSMG